MKDFKFDFGFTVKFSLLFGALFSVFGYLLIKTNSMMLENILERYAAKRNKYYVLKIGEDIYKFNLKSGRATKITKEIEEVNGIKVQKTCHTPVKRCKSL